MRRWRKSRLSAWPLALPEEAPLELPEVVICLLRRDEVVELEAGVDAEEPLRLLAVDAGHVAPTKIHPCCHHPLRCESKIHDKHIPTLRHQDASGSVGDQGCAMEAPMTTDREERVLLAVLDGRDHFGDASGERLTYAW